MTQMFPLQALTDWWSLQRSSPEKREALRELYERWVAIRRQASASRQLTPLAETMRTQRQRISSQLGEVTACTRCARGCPLPQGQWEGGYCCGGNTHELFSDLEILALQLAGTRFSDLTPPTDPQAGCLFRGAKGCSLPPKHRPSQCLTYVCRDLSRELAGRPDQSELLLLHEQLEQQRDAFLAKAATDEDERTQPHD